MIMAQPTPDPDPQTLVPPLLAYLPTSFASSRPPPTLLPLLSPILRQRLHIHTTSSNDSHDSWVRLLCWDSAKAEKLKDIVENTNFEPHPVSGEMEVGEVDTIKYRRFDQETLKAHIALADWDLSAMYLWCVGGEDGDDWKLAELLPFESDLLRDPAWSRSIQEADNLSRQKNATLSLQTQGWTSQRKPLTAGGDDDDYWAMYDNTPGPTPARATRNPAGQSENEEDYYARYGSVQPALDAHDPDEEQQELEESSLNGHALQEMLAKNSVNGRTMGFSAINEPSKPHREESEEERLIPVRQPTPSSPRSRASTETIERLEDEAEKYAASEIGIRQHISYSIKSMYRLAKSAGIARSEFEDMVQREMETLSILDLDDL